MKRFSIAGAALTMLASGSALAADLPVKAPPVPVAVFSWAGPYIGVNIGYSWGRETVSGLVTGASPAALFGSGSLNGALGGGQVGYNWQFGSWLVGLEGDIQVTAERQTYTVFCTVSGTVCPLGAAVRAENRLSWFGTDRVRFGYLASERVLLYGTGGLAYGSFRGESAGPLFISPGPEFGTWSSFKAGWTVGAGIEAAIDYNWTFKAEYLYMDFEGINGPTVTVLSPPVRTFSFNERFTDNIFRVGFNYRFAPAAVVAKY